MARWLKTGVACGLFIVAALLGAGSAPAQDAALRDRVNQLVDRLASDGTEARDAAEKALVGLGVKVLPLLPEADTLKSDDQKQRLERVRQGLAAAEEKGRLVATKVTIRGKGIRLTEAIKQLQQQTGNVVSDMREQMGEDVTNPQLDLELADKPFFEALDTICGAAGLIPYFYTGNGTVGLLTGGRGPAAATGGEASARVAYNGPFRISFKQLAISRDFASGMATANAQFEVAWEPRLRPMLLALKSEDIAITDDRGKTIEPSVSEESSSIVIRPENPIAEINLNMTAPERAAQKLATLKVKAELSLPAGLRTFRFAELAKSTELRQGDVRVSVNPVDVEDNIWKYRVMLYFPGKGPAFESYQQGLFNNRLWLQSSDGGRLGHDGPHGGGFNTLGSDEGKLAFEYLFVDVPGKPADYSFVYETPSRVEAIPLEFEFKDVPLP